LETNHWHPILQEHELNHRPVSISIFGKEIVLFRDSIGKISALDDICPHRRMRLSKGKIIDSTIQCPYHGWKIDGQGNCESSANGKMNVRANAYDVVVRYGVIWIRAIHSICEFPIFETEGYHFISTFASSIEAPLEIVLDNFTETEHTSFVHALLGFELGELKNAEIKFEQTDTSTRLFNKALQKKVPFLIRHFVQIKTGDYFIDDWTSFFSPIYTVYEQYWTNGNSEQDRPVKLRIFVFFNPITKDKTGVFTFTYMKYNKLGNLGLNLLIKPIMKQIVKLEVSLDKKMIESIASKETSLKGTRLGRFDKALGPNRNKIEKIYRGNQSIDIEKN